MALRSRFLRLLAVMLTLTAALTFGGERSAYAEGPPEDPRARAIARELQCPICENNSVLDSPSELAQQMYGIIKDQVAAGKSREEILQYFVDRYGEVVLREPPKTGFTLLVWVGPMIAALIAALGVGSVVRSRLRNARTAEPEPALGSADTARYSAQLEHELARLEER